jgi:ATP-dependent protease ClpP protease subunit
MPNWNQVLKEIQQSHRKDALDYIRVKYLKRLHKKTGRNIICYYSGWLQKKSAPGLEIIDNDKNGFMTCVHKLDRTIGLDLFLHTPGGQVAATESLVDYLRKMFGNDIRAVVPQIAMSAGTMVACSCKNIIMGKQSNIGPIDPQFGGIPAQGVISEFKRALSEVQKNPATIPIWQTIVGKYHPTFIEECQHAVDLSESLVEKWLKDNMLSECSDKDKIAQNILKTIASHADTKTHFRHIHLEESRDIGLKILSIEDDFDDEYQDLILTIHHCFMHTFAQSSSRKIIENHKGQRMVNHEELTNQIPIQIKGFNNPGFQPGKESNVLLDNHQESTPSD